MENHQPLTVVHGFQKSLLVCLGPARFGRALGRIFVIQQQHVIFREVFIRQVFGRADGHIDLDLSPVSRCRQARGGVFPGVSVVARDDQHLDRCGTPAGPGQCVE